MGPNHHHVLSFIEAIELAADVVEIRPRIEPSVNSRNKRGDDRVEPSEIRHHFQFQQIARIPRPSNGRIRRRRFHGDDLWTRQAVERMEGNVARALAQTSYQQRQLGRAGVSVGRYLDFRLPLIRLLPELLTEGHPGLAIERFGILRRPIGIEERVLIGDEERGAPSAVSFTCWVS